MNNSHNSEEDNQSKKSKCLENKKSIERQEQEEDLKKSQIKEQDVRCLFKILGKETKEIKIEQKSHKKRIKSRLYQKKQQSFHSKSGVKHQKKKKQDIAKHAASKSNSPRYGKQDQFWDGFTWVSKTNFHNKVREDKEKIKSLTSIKRRIQICNIPTGLTSQDLYAEISNFMNRNSLIDVGNAQPILNCQLNEKDRTCILELSSIEEANMMLKLEDIKLLEQSCKILRLDENLSGQSQLVQQAHNMAQTQAATQVLLKSPGQNDLEILNEKKKIASLLIQDVSYNIMINSKRAELSDKEFLRWLDKMKRLDQQKSVLIKEGEQYQKFLNQVNIKQTQTYEQLGFFHQLKQQEELKKIQAQINKKTQLAQKLIDLQILNEAATKDEINKKRVEDNQQMIQEIQQEIQQETDYVINDEIKKNSKFDEFDEVEMENNLDKLKYQSKKASKGKLLNNIVKIFIPLQKKEL